MLWADTDAVRGLCEALGADPAVNQVLYVQDTPVDLTPDAAAEWKATRDGLVVATMPGVGRAVASGLPELMPDEVATELATVGVTALAGIPAALRALQAHTLQSAEPERLRSVAATVRTGASGDWLAEHEGKQLLARHGVSVPEGQVVTSVAAAVEAAAALGGPVAMKISHPEVQHKSDLDGVLLGIDGEAKVEAAARQLLQLRPDGAVLVERMADRGIELLVAATREGVVPSLVVGIGGVWTEVLQDAVVVPLPADVHRIEAALRGLRSWPMLSGARGQEPLAVDRVCRLAAAAATALLEEPLALVELNPVIVTRTDAVAVDALVRRWLDAGA
jgi:acetyl-CoA synthetase